MLVKHPYRSFLHMVSESNTVFFYFFRFKDAFSATCCFRASEHDLSRFEWIGLAEHQPGYAREYMYCRVLYWMTIIFNKREIK